MPGPQLTTFQSDPSLPSRVDVVVIGGGIIGVSTALELAERGVSVLLCEKGQIGGEQSSRNWGWVRLSMRDLREIPLMIAAHRIWVGLDARLGRATGYTPSGILYAAQDQRTYDKRAAWAARVKDFDQPAQMLSGAALDALLPGHHLRMLGALHTPLDGRAEPQWAAPAIAEGARARCARIVTGCAVRALDLQAGRVAGVITERARVACEAVVLAGGAWSRLFAGNAGINLPQLQTLSTVMRTTPVSGAPETALWTNGFALRLRADGGYTIASGNDNLVDLVPDSLRLGRQFFPAYLSERTGLRFRLSAASWQALRQPRRWSAEDRTVFEDVRILDPEPSQRALRRSWAAARAGFPVLQGAEVVQSWAGMIDVTPDAIPVISGVGAVPGLTIATGFSGHGFGIGPAAGHLAADLVTGATPLVDPQPFRLSRFSDGSKIRLNL